MQKKNNNNRFSNLKKCKTKFDCLVFEMFFINELRPSLDVQSDALVLHLTYIYAYSFNFFFTYLKTTENWLKRCFLSVIFTVLRE